MLLDSPVRKFNFGRQTRADENVNKNNIPILAGDIFGTHKDTVYEADYLFRRIKLWHFAEVDSELLGRLVGISA